MSIRFFIPLTDPNPRAQELIRIFDEMLRQKEQENELEEERLRNGGSFNRLPSPSPSISSADSQRTDADLSSTPEPRFPSSQDLIQEIKKHAHIIHNRSSVDPVVLRNSYSASHTQINVDESYSHAQMPNVDESYYNPCMCACHGSSRATSPEQQHPTSNKDSSEHSELQLRKEEQHQMISNPTISPLRHQHRRRARDHSQQSIPSRITRYMRRRAMRQTRQSKKQENKGLDLWELDQNGRPRHA